VGEIWITLYYDLSTKLSTALSTKNKMLSTGVYVRLASSANNRFVPLILGGS